MGKKLLALLLCRGAPGDGAGRLRRARGEGCICGTGQPTGGDTEGTRHWGRLSGQPRNQDGIGEKELLVVSFGTSYNDNRRLTIGAIENAMEEAFPGMRSGGALPARLSLIM